MWTDEIIFSEGDLCDPSECGYHEFIQNEYQGNYFERLDHVLSMIKRLEAEKALLLSGSSEFSK